LSRSSAPCLDVGSSSFFFTDHIAAADEPGGYTDAGFQAARRLKSADYVDEA
jgi:hypothetical protein